MELNQKIEAVLFVFHELEKVLEETGITVVHGGYDTISDDIFHLYEGDKFIGGIKIKHKRNGA